MKDATVFIAKQTIQESPIAFSDTSVRELASVLAGMFDSLGGALLPAKGSKVLVKPNLVRPGLSYGPAVTTDPRVVAALCGLLRDQGAKSVCVGDDPGWGLTSTQAYQDWGQSGLLARWGGTLVPFDTPDRFTVKVRRNRLLPEVALPAALADVDFFINVPKMKTHMLTGVSLGIKNLHGLVGDDSRLCFHRGDIECKLVDILCARIPDLTVVDGIWALEGQAPLYGDVIRDMNVLVGGVNPVAVDAVSAMIMGFDPHQLTHLREAHARGLGPLSLAHIKLLGDSMEHVMHPFRRALLSSVAVYKTVEVVEGGADLGVLSALRHALDRLSLEGRLDDMNPVTVLVGGFLPGQLPRIGTKEVWLMGDAAVGIQQRIRPEHELHLVPGDAPHIFDFYKEFVRVHGGGGWMGEWGREEESVQRSDDRTREESGI